MIHCAFKHFSLFFISNIVSIFFTMYFFFHFRLHETRSRIFRVEEKNIYEHTWRKMIFFVAVEICFEAALGENKTIFGNEMKYFVRFFLFISAMHGKTILIRQWNFQITASGIQSMGLRRIERLGEFQNLDSSNGSWKSELIITSTSKFFMKTKYVV